MLRSVIWHFLFKNVFEKYHLICLVNRPFLQPFWRVFKPSQVFYLPMALAVPPSVFAVHIEFNLLYQFWIHTEVSRLCAWVCVRVCVYEITSNHQLNLILPLATQLLSHMAG